MFEVWVCFWHALGVRAASCNVSLCTVSRHVLSVLQAGGRAGQEAGSGTQGLPGELGCSPAQPI